jgi:hypothetical protein
MRIGTFEVEIAGRPGTVGFEDEIEPAGIENPITDNHGNLNTTGPL